MQAARTLDRGSPSIAGSESGCKRSTNISRNALLALISCVLSAKRSYSAVGRFYNVGIISISNVSSFGSKPRQLRPTVPSAERKSFQRIALFAFLAMHNLTHNLTEEIYAGTVSNVQPDCPYCISSFQFNNKIHRTIDYQHERFTLNRNSVLCNFTQANSTTLLSEGANAAVKGR